MRNQLNKTLSGGETKMSEWVGYTKYDRIAVNQAEAILGVYMLAVKLTNGELKVFYVGSGNVKERLLAHLLPNEPNRGIRAKVEKYYCLFAYKEVLGGEQARKAEEQQLIKKYNPKCNEVDAVA